MRHLRQYPRRLAILYSHPSWLLRFRLLTCTSHTEIDSNNDLWPQFVGGSHRGCADESLHQDDRLKPYKLQQYVSEVPTYIIREIHGLTKRSFGLRQPPAPDLEFISPRVARVHYAKCIYAVATVACCSFGTLPRIGNIVHTSAACMTQSSPEIAVDESTLRY